MSEAKPPIHAAIVAPPGATASTLFGAHDVLSAARRNIGQQPCAMVSWRQNGDAAIAKRQEWVAENCDHTAPVNAMAELSNLSVRSCKRRFVKETGLAPLEYVQILRLEEAKQMLEATD